VSSVQVVVWLKGMAVAPLTLDGLWTDTGLLAPPAKVLPEAQAPAVYHYLAGLPPGTVVAEFPFGYPAWELRYVFYASVHQQRLLNDTAVASRRDTCRRRTCSSGL